MDGKDDLQARVLNWARREMNDEEYGKFRDLFLAHWPQTAAILKRAQARKTAAGTIAGDWMARFAGCSAAGGLARWLMQAGEDAVITLRIPDGVVVEDDPSKGGLNRVSLAYPDGSGLVFWVDGGRLKAALARKMAPYDVFRVINERCVTLSLSWGRVPVREIEAFVRCMDIDLDKLLARWDELYPGNEALSRLRPSIEAFRRTYARELAAFGMDKSLPEDGEPGGEPGRESEPPEQSRGSS